MYKYCTIFYCRCVIQCCLLLQFNTAVVYCARRVPAKGFWSNWPAEPFQAPSLTIHSIRLYRVLILTVMFINLCIHTACNIPNEGGKWHACTTPLLCMGAGGKCARKKRLSVKFYKSENFIFQIYFFDSHSVQHKLLVSPEEHLEHVILIFSAKHFTLIQCNISC